MRTYDAAIFDLDGTLLNTLEDLADSVNYALRLSALPCRTLDEVRQFVGNGVTRLIDRAVPTGTADIVKGKCLQDFQGHYVQHMQDKTAPYPGILALLRTLKKEGYRLAVASNKFDNAVKALCPVYFESLVDIAVGESETVQKKPAPDMVLQAMSEMGVERSRTIYIGDSDVDVETARNAGIPCIAVTWGFRDRAFLLEHGADVVADTTEEVYTLLTALAQ